MANKLRKQVNYGNEENIFWITMSDLLLGLAIVFITLFVIAMTGFSQQTIQQQKAQMEVSNKISDQLKKSEVSADVDNMTGDLKIPDVELFELGSWVLTDNGKNCWINLLRYILILFLLIKNLQNKLNML